MERAITTDIPTTPSGTSAPPGPPGDSPLVRLLSPLRDFLHKEATGALLLAGAAVVALIWANSPWSGSYDSLWSTKMSLSLGDHGLSLDLRHWVNDGLMTIFFLLVGLEIKRELVTGHLSTKRAALLPAMAALGGMVVPAGLYLAIAGSTAPRGWAIPMATDIALAVGVLAVAGSRLPSSLRAFLLGLAIVDDIGAIVVIAAVYSSGVRGVWLVVAVGGVAVVLAARRLGIFVDWIYVLIGVVIWYALHEAGIHPTLAGVAMGLLAPSTPRVRPEYIDADDLADVSSLHQARATTSMAKGTVSSVEWLQHVLHPWSSYLIVPIFALANSGIEISRDGLNDALRSPISWGILVGLVVGKPLGVMLASRLTVRAGVADEPRGATQQQSLGIGAAAGIGFTVALFITELAFEDPARQTEAKIGILVASVLAAVFAALLLRFERPSRPTEATTTERAATTAG